MLWSCKNSYKINGCCDGDIRLSILEMFSSAPQVSRCVSIVEYRVRVGWGEREWRGGRINVFFFSQRTLRSEIFRLVCLTWTHFFHLGKISSKYQLNCDRPSLPALQRPHTKEKGNVYDLSKHWKWSQGRTLIPPLSVEKHKRDSTIVIFVEV